MDDDLMSSREDEEANETWKAFRISGRLLYIRENRPQFDFRDWSDMRRCVEGEYFAGCASSLLY